LYLSIIIL